MSRGIVDCGLRILDCGLRIGKGVGGIPHKQGEVGASQFLAGGEIPAPTDFMSVAP